MVRKKDKPVEKQVVEVLEPVLEVVEAKTDQLPDDEQLELQFMPTERKQPARLRAVRRHPMV